MWELSKPGLGVMKCHPHVRETVNSDLMWTGKPVKEWQIAVHISKGKNNPKRIAGGNHQHCATRDAEDAPYSKT